MAALRLTPRIGKDVIHSLIVASMFVATGDIFFVFHVAGMTIRLMQGFLFLATLFYFTNRGNDNHIIIPNGFIYILICFTASFVCFPNYFWTRNVSYSFGFFFCLLMVLLVTNYYGRSEDRLKLLLAWFIRACVFVALFGILQTVVGIAGIKLLTQQWYIPGVFARANGFSYEPSYFALYNSFGWAMLLYLVVDRVDILPRRQMIAALWITTAAALCSTSRSALGMSYLFFLLFALRCLFRARRGYKISPWFWCATVIGLAAPVLGFFYMLYKNPMVLQIMISGLGIMGGADHSVGARSTDTLNTLAVALNHPLLGTGLGGVGPAIASKATPGLTMAQYYENRIEGLNIFLEAFATGGLLSGLCLLIYIVKLYLPGFSRRKDESWLHKVNMALLFGLSSELILLAMEQNIVRMHLWVAISLVTAVNYRVLLTAKTSAAGPSAPRLMRAPEVNART